MGSSGVRGCGAQVYAAAQAVWQAERSVTGVLLPVAAGDAAGMAPQQRKNLSDYSHAKFKGTSTGCSEAVALEHPCGAAIPHPALHVQVRYAALRLAVRRCGGCPRRAGVSASRRERGLAIDEERWGAPGRSQGLRCPRCWRYRVKLPFTSLVCTKASRQPCPPVRRLSGVVTDAAWLHDITHILEPATRQPLCAKNVLFMVRARWDRRGHQSRGVSPCRAPAPLQ